MSSDYYTRVYEVVAKIPSGKVTTYGAIAAALGMKSGARLVGWALNKAKGSDLPCHRVVNRNGQLTGKAYFGNINEMRVRLEAEGVTFKNEAVDIEKFLWLP